MTQEELDALMAGDLDEESLEEEIDEKSKEESQENQTDESDIDEEEQYANYRIDSNKAWPPPPPTDDHRMVHQLDDVTKDSEVKATEIFDKLETISQYALDTEDSLSEAMGEIDGNIEIFTKLSTQFPDVETFKSALESNQKVKTSLEESIDKMQMSSDEIMMIMDIMQYQDIHRQKIERVINVMRALSKYMSKLFEGKVDDAKRVSSAVHIQGDSTTDDVVTSDDIEELIATLGKKK